MYLLKYVMKCYSSHFDLITSKKYIIMLRHTKLILCALAHFDFYVHFEAIYSFLPFMFIDFFVRTQVCNVLYLFCSWRYEKTHHQK